MLERRLRISGKSLGERRGSNPRMVEPQSTALPLGYARQIKRFYIFFTVSYYNILVSECLDFILRIYSIFQS